MIAHAESLGPRPTPNWHAAFLAMVPVISRYARASFREFDPETREDLVHEAVANCVVAYARLVERGKESIAYPTVLAMYAVKQIKDGRRVGKPRGAEVLPPLVTPVLLQLVARRAPLVGIVNLLRPLGPGLRVTVLATVGTFVGPTHHKKKQGPRPQGEGLLNWREESTGSLSQTSSVRSCTAQPGRPRRSSDTH